MANRKSNPGAPIKSVRRRLWLLLFRAFGVVVLMIVALTLIATFMVLGNQTSQNPYYQSPMAYLLMSYYQGRGDWQGVEGLLEGDNGLSIPYLRREWQHSRLLDASGRVLVDKGQAASELVGEVYTAGARETAISLVSAGQVVGTLIVDGNWSVSPLGFGLDLFPPIIIASILLGFMTWVIGLLLMRRVVDPLAEVIAAAQGVAGGDFTVRVPLHKRHDDLYALSASFNQMTTSLQRNDEQRRAMLADVAHELRTPLTILRGRLEGILDGIYAADAAHIAPALEEVYLLDCLVDDLRLLTLAEARQLPMELRPVDLEELAEKVVNTFEAEAAEQNIRLCANEPGVGDSAGPAFTVCADPQRLEQVLSNLIGNALRYVPNGGAVIVNLCAPPQPTQIHSSAANGLENGSSRWVALTVSDDGPGVPQAELDYLFDRFWRGEKSRGRATGGSGLGLTIAKQLIEAMGGEIWARNSGRRRVGGGVQTAAGCGGLRITDCCQRILTQIERIRE